MTAARFLTVPGYTGSGPRHWQTLWEAGDGAFSRIEQDDWDHPEVEPWTGAIEQAVQREVKSSVVLVAHSAGTTAVAHWAIRHATVIAGAFLVAPPDTERSEIDAVRAFSLPFLRQLPFPAIVVASEDDPYCAYERALAMARSWGAAFVSAGRAGHINSASGHGPWPEGRQLLASFCARIGFQ